RIADALVERRQHLEPLRERDPAIVDARRVQKRVLGKLLRDGGDRRRALAIAQIAQRRAYQPPGDPRTHLRASSFITRSLSSRFSSCNFSTASRSDLTCSSCALPSASLRATSRARRR